MSAQRMVISTLEAARRLGISDRHVRLLLSTGVLRGERIGRDWVIQASSLKKFQRHPTKGRPKALSG